MKRSGDVLLKTEAEFWADYRFSNAYDIPNEQVRRVEAAPGGSNGN